VLFLVFSSIIKEHNLCPILELLFINSFNYPDYNDPFLMFDVDPNKYVFCDDFTNNIPDSQKK